MANVSIGINLSTSAAPGADPVGDARHAEKLGFDFLTASDHPSGSHPTLETWTLLTWVAAHTERIGLVPNVIGLPYREPPILAKMAESLDRLSAGRLTLGLGAGANDAALRSFGLPVRSAGEKVEALGEAIEILHGLWSDQTFSYQGRRYRTEEARIEPRASRRIPIWLGTYGPKGLDLTGRLADGWTPSLPYAPLPQAVKMRERVLEAAAAAGRSPDAVVCNLNFGVLVDGGSARREQVVVGSAEEVADRMVEFVRAGFTSLNFWPLREDREQIERLAGEVLPAVRSAVQTEDIAISSGR